eukprot:6343565-Amphidinium_carterae.1
MFLVRLDSLSPQRWKAFTYVVARKLLRREGHHSLLARSSNAPWKRLNGRATSSSNSKYQDVQP